MVDRHCEGRRKRRIVAWAGYCERVCDWAAAGGRWAKEARGRGGSLSTAAAGDVAVAAAPAAAAVGADGRDCLRGHCVGGGETCYRSCQLVADHPLAAVAGTARRLRGAPRKRDPTQQIPPPSPPAPAAAAAAAAAAAGLVPRMERARQRAVHTGGAAGVHIAAAAAAAAAGGGGGGGAAAGAAVVGGGGGGGGGGAGAAACGVVASPVPQVGRHGPSLRSCYRVEGEA